MKRITNCILIICLMASAAPVWSQSKPDNRGIAPFKIVLPNGRLFTAAELKKGMPVMLVYFSPDCDHCMRFTKDLLKNYAVFKNKQVVMVTYRPVEELKQFSLYFNLPAYPNIKAGTEGTSFIVRQYYTVLHFPMVALYNKHNKPAGLFREEVPFDQIVSAVRKLQ